MAHIVDWLSGNVSMAHRADLLSGECINASMAHLSDLLSGKCINGPQS